MRFKHFAVVFCLAMLLGTAFAQGSSVSIELIKPDESVSYKKNQPLEIEARVSVTGNAAVQEVKAFIGAGFGAPLQIALEKNAQGNYSGSINLGFKVHNNAQFDVFVKVKDDGGNIVMESKSASIEFAPDQMSIDFELVPAPPYYLGSRIEKIIINTFYSDGSRVPAENFERAYLRIGRERKRLDLKENESGALEAELGYQIDLSEEFMMGMGSTLDLELMDMVNDRYGNSGESAGKSIEVNESHNSLKLRIKNPQSNERLFHSIEIPFEIELTKSEDAEVGKVYLTDSRDLSNKRECQKAGEEGEKVRFSCMEKLPSMDEVRMISYVALAEALVEGENITVYDISQNEVGNFVHLGVEVPSDREQLDGLENSVEVNFFYGMTAKLEGGSYSGTINGTPVEFAWSPEKERYIAEFDLKALGEGEHDLEFEVEGMELEDDRVTVNFVSEGAFPFGSPDGEGLDPLVMLGSVVALFALFTFVVWFLVLRKKKEETTDELEEEAKMLKDLLKRTEVDYYKRRLDEEEYKKRVLEYQAKLDSALAKMKAKQ